MSPSYSYKMKHRIAYFLLIPVLSLTACSWLPFESDSNEESKPSSFSSSEEESSSTESSSSSSSSSSKIDNVPEGYELSWSDEFEGDTLSSDWEPMIGDGSNYGIYRWGNNEEQYYKRENAVVHDGMLHIIAKKEQASYTDDNGLHTYDYTSARLRTKGKVVTTYGYIESRMKLPAGTGMWPAFWMLPEDSFEGRWWPTNGEIDIMEARGRVLNKFGSTIHTGNASGQDVYQTRDYTFQGNDITAFHSYGVEWTNEEFCFYIDGLLFFSVTANTYQAGNELYKSSSANAPFDRPFHILLNLAVGGNYDGGNKPDASFTEAHMVVDYVRIYQKN